MLFINYCLLISPIGNSICLNWMSDFVEGTCSTLPFQSHQIHSMTYSRFRLTFCFPCDLFCSTLLETVHSQLWSFFSKMFFCSDNFRQIWNANIFFNLIIRYANIIVIHISKCFQMPYNVHKRYAEYLCNVLFHVTWIILNWHFIFVIVTDGHCRSKFSMTYLNRYIYHQLFKCHPFF